MKQKVLVLGKTGMLGHLLYTFLSKQSAYDVVGTTRSELDAYNDSEKDIANKINKFSPTIVINCIGIINKYAENNPTLTYKVNSDFPQIVARLAKKQGFKLIHISSDCYLDSDTYGKSKRMGEINDSYNLTIRTSIIGPELKQGFGLFHWALTQKEEVSGFTKALWDGVTTLQLAYFIDECIQKNKTGLIDYRTKQSLSKYELLKIIYNTFNRVITIQKDDRYMKDKRNNNADAWCKKNYMTQLNELKMFMTQHKQQYEHYFEHD